MNRTTNPIFGIFLLAASALALAQDVQSTHPFPEDAFSTRELVAWSHLQTPQPAPKPLPVPDAQVPRPDQSRVSVVPQIFVGKVVRDSGADRGKYVLQAANFVYRLDGEIDSRAEDKVVNVVGTQVDSNGTIHVLRIEPLR